MTQNLNIREAEATDAPNIAALAMHVWLHTYAKEGVRQEISEFVFSSFSPSTMSELIRDPAQTVLVAYDDVNLLGYAILHKHSECPTDARMKIELATLYVQPHFAGKGIGSALLQACTESNFASTGSTSLWLTTWHRNDNAIKFYLNQGFQQIGSTHFQLGEEKHENFIFAR
jgi:ribosomal protein S18 acetylase RimI-like enzyme